MRKAGAPDGDLQTNKKPASVAGLQNPPTAIETAAGVISLSAVRGTPSPGTLGTTILVKKQAPANLSPANQVRRRSRLRYGRAAKRGRRLSDETVVLIDHDSINWALLLQLLDQQPSAYWRAEEDPCAINLLQVKNGAIRVVSVNDTPTLPAVRVNGANCGPRQKPRSLDTSAAKRTSEPSASSVISYRKGAHRRLVLFSVDGSPTFCRPLCRQPCSDLIDLLTLKPIAATPQQCKTSGGV